MTEESVVFGGGPKQKDIRTSKPISTKKDVILFYFVDYSIPNEITTLMEAARIGRH